MILNSELRIGNYVNVKGKVRKIAMISNFKDLVNIPSIGYYVGEDIEYFPSNDDHLQPLQLTEDVLKECGFLFDHYFQLWQKAKEKIGSGMELELDTSYNVVDFLRRPLLKEVTTVHCLQNFYFALKGKELVFRPLPAIKE